ncbi:MAG: hypothetical protein SFY56_04635 [Bacteroidota bacterium]|nr:hypothetical protein [Bacteroidota bacterium]
MKIIYTIPGIGATEKLFQNISIPNYKLKVLNWPEPKKEFTMQDYAREFLKQINTSQPVYLMGVSFGGMLCSQISDYIPTEKIILISSCKTKKQFPFLLKLNRILPIYKIISDDFIKWLAKSKRRMLGFDKSFDKTLLEMIESMPKNYFKNCIGYIINWDKESDNKTNLIQIHGTNDLLLPHKKIENCILVQGGSHTMVISKAFEINLILNEQLNG